MQLDWQETKHSKGIDGILHKAKYIAYNTPTGPAYAITYCYDIGYSKYNGQEYDHWYQCNTQIIDPFLKPISKRYIAQRRFCDYSMIDAASADPEEFLAAIKQECERFADELIAGGPFDESWSHREGGYLYGDEDNLKKIAYWFAEKEDANIERISYVDKKMHRIDCDVLAGGYEPRRWIIEVDYDSASREISVECYEK